MASTGETPAAASRMLWATSCSMTKPFCLRTVSFGCGELESLPLCSMLFQLNLGGVDSVVSLAGEASSSGQAAALSLLEGLD
eukprot:1519338-Ditylum_brightwellii.AAC.1